MNDSEIITVYVLIDDVLRLLDHHSDCRAQLTDAEILTIAVVAAQHFQNHHATALFWLVQGRYLARPLSASRFNRRLHALADWLPLLLALRGEVFTQGEVFIADSLPVPVCKRVRAWHCGKVRGREYCGWCEAKKEKFFGWRLHLICTPEGVPVSYSLLPAARHDLTSIHELTVGLPEGSRVLCDKAFNSAADEASILAAVGVRLVPVRKQNPEPQPWADREDLRLYRHTIETVNSQWEKMDLERLYARTNAGLDIKVHASLLAVACRNLN